MLEPVMASSTNIYIRRKSYSKADGEYAGEQAQGLIAVTAKVTRWAVDGKVSAGCRQRDGSRSVQVTDGWELWVYGKVL
ncbi:hypothetical protein NL676_023939 [Syzygium grande]|nr:hypothetical protein NL676_023939 [Syzygium grande]